MNDDLFRMLELSRQGLNCSQIIVALGLEDLDNSNADLVHAMAALGGGVGFCGKTCGALTGGACLLSYYAGLDSNDETDFAITSMGMTEELVHWFEQEFGQLYGGTNCEEMLGPAFAKRVPQPACANIVSATYSKAKMIAAAHDLKLAGEGDV